MIKSGLRIKVFLMFILAIALTGLMLFLPAGTLDYWQAWIFIASLFIPCIFVVAYLLKYSPNLLERRLRFREKEPEQKRLIKLTQLLLFLGFIVPGLDHRYGWSNIPMLIVIIADVLVFLGYTFIFFVFKENSYASRVIEVDKGQTVISTGPYSVIRHPMYAGVIVMFMAMPIALGSYWMLLLFLPILVLLIIRTLNEEKALLRALKGYKEYCRKVKYRLIPCIW